MKKAVLILATVLALISCSQLPSREKAQLPQQERVQHPQREAAQRPSQEKAQRPKREAGTGVSQPSGTSRREKGVIEIGTLRGPSAIEMVRMIDSLSEGKNGMRVRIYEGPLEMRKEMIRGRVDYAVMPSAMAALQYNKGIDYRVAALTIEGGLILCGTDTTIHSITDLRGRTISVSTRGTTPDILLRYLLSRSETGIFHSGRDEAADFSPVSGGAQTIIDYRFPTPSDLANAAIAGRTQFCILPEPLASQVLGLNPDLHRLLDIGREWEKSEGMPLPETLLLSKAGADKATTDAVLRALESSSLWVSANPEKAASLAVKHGINPDSAAVINATKSCAFNVIRTKEAEKEIKYYLRVILACCPEALGGRMPDETFYEK